MIKVWRFKTFLSAASDDLLNGLQLQSSKITLVLVNQLWQTATLFALLSTFSRVFSLFFLHSSYLLCLFPSSSSSRPSSSSSSSFVRTNWSQKPQHSKHSTQPRFLSVLRFPGPSLAHTNTQESVPPARLGSAPHTDLCLSGWRRQSSLGATQQRNLRTKGQHGRPPDGPTAQHAQNRFLSLEPLVYAIVLKL